MGSDRRIIVVGGGIIGICCAYYLAKRGADVTVVERDEIGKGASYGNAGTIAPGHGPVNKPGRVKQALKSVFDPLSPLYVAPRWDPRLAQWLVSFSRYCSRQRLEYALRVMAPLSHATVALFDELVQQEALECGYRRAGYYEVYRTDAGVAAGAHEAELVRRHGFAPEVLVRDQLRERIPVLHHDVVGGVYFPEGSTVDPYRLVTELAQRTQGYGASIRAGAAVSEVLAPRGTVMRVRTENGETIDADTVVLATGAYSLELSRRLGVRLPLQAGKGYHRDRDLSAGGTPALTATCMLGETSVFCTPLEGKVRFAGTMEFSGVNHELRRERLEQLTKAAGRYLDGMADVESQSEWCGLRPCIADGLPVIGALPAHPNVFLATGHAMLGLTLGPVTGKLIAESVLDGTTSIDVTPFSPARFG